jgi:hypothetical protein
MIGSCEVREAALRLNSKNDVDQAKWKTAVGVVSMRWLLLFASCAVWWSACGNGPKVPHAVENRTDESCLSCHGSGANQAPRTPHPSKTGCLGCHE